MADRSTIVQLENDVETVINPATEDKQNTEIVLLNDIYSGISGLGSIYARLDCTNQPFTGAITAPFGTQFGTATQYWKIESLDLGIWGVYPMLAGYSDGAFGTLGVIKDNLLIVSSTGNPTLAFADSNNLGLIPQMYYDIADARLETSGDFYVNGTLGSLGTLAVDGPIYAYSDIVVGNGIEGVNPTINFSGYYVSWYSMAPSIYWDDTNLWTTIYNNGGNAVLNLDNGGSGGTLYFAGNAAGQIVGDANSLIIYPPFDGANWGNVFLGDGRGAFIYQGTDGAQGGSVNMGYPTLAETGYVVKLNEDSALIRTVDATSSVTKVNSRALYFQSSYWTGEGQAKRTMRILNIMDSTAPTYHLSFKNNGGTEVAALSDVGVLAANYHQTSTAPTANSSGTVVIAAKDANLLTANAGWLPMKRSDGTTVYLPYWL